MRVLWLIEAKDPRMGSERAVATLAKGMQKNGWEIEIANPRTADSRQADLVHWFNAGGSKLHSLEFLRKLRGQKPIICTMIYWPFTKEQINQVYKLGGVSAISGSLPALIQLESQVFRIAELADILIFNASTEAEVFLQAGKEMGADLSEAKVRIVPNVIDPDELCPPKPWEKRKEIVATVGRIELLKNQISVISALSALKGRFPDVQYWLVGKDYLRLSSYPVWVRKLGPRPPEQVFRIYSKIKVHILASFRDTPGLVSLEAAASGANIVVSRKPFGTAHEYFPEDLAYFVNPLSETDIALGIADALKNPPNPALAQLVLERYSLPVAVRKMEKIYQEVA